MADVPSLPQLRDRAEALSDGYHARAGAFDAMEDGREPGTRWGELSAACDELGRQAEELMKDTYEVMDTYRAELGDPS